MVHHGRRALGILLACFGLFAVTGLTTSARGAEFGIVPGSFVVKMLDAGGNPETRAGSHPDSLQIDFKLELEGTGTSVRDLIIEMPPGFGGNLAAVPECPRQAYEEGEECPPDTQVGVVNLGSPSGELPVFQLQPPPGQVAAFASKPGIELPFTMRLRPDDYGIDFEAIDLPEVSQSDGHMELWGVPANHQGGPPSQPRPFLTAPSVCGPLTFFLHVRSRQEGAPWLSASTQAGPLDGCASLPFAPELGLQLSNPIADSPTGLRMELSSSEEDSASGLASAQMRDVTVEMPTGLTFSPGGAASLSACSAAQLDRGSDTEATCPASSKVGSVEFSSAALRQPLSGTVYLGEAQGGERFRLFVVASGSGTVLKFIAAMHTDPVTGRLSATLLDLPPVAIGHLSMNLDGGPGGLLATPLGCGQANGAAKFVPYGGGAPVVSPASVTVASLLPGLSCPGPLPFAPELRVEGSNHRAGRPSSFSTILARHDGEQLPARFSVTLPAGLSAALGTVRTCPEAAAGAGTCPVESRVGSARAAMGSGPAPTALQGNAYLAGPYHRAPFSLVMAFHAAIGPLDLGTVSFRAAAQFDGRTGRVTVTTDRLPDQIEGVAVRFKTIEFNLDRPNLIRNPTSCGSHDVDATIEAQGGATLAKATPFLVSSCKSLGFRPRIRLALSGKRRLREHDSVGLRMAARLRRGDTGLRAVELSLPPAVQFDISKLKEICSRRDAIQGLCPEGARVGSAGARTALLDEPLEGSVYVVQPKGNGLPDIWVDLATKGVHLSVRGTTTADHGRFVTKLAGLPDMPLSQFDLQLGLGSGSVFSLNASPCIDGRPRRFESTLTAVGQNGARRNLRLPVETKPHCAAAGRR